MHIWTFMGIAQFRGPFMDGNELRSSGLLPALQCSVMSLLMEFTSTGPPPSTIFNGSRCAIITLVPGPNYNDS